MAETLRGTLNEETCSERIRLQNQIVDLQNKILTLDEEKIFIEIRLGAENKKITEELEESKKKTVSI